MTEKCLANWGRFNSLISGAIGTGATRDTAETVEAYIKERVPAE